MPRLPEISSLFASLASNLHSLDPNAGNEVDLSISDLNRSLNPSEAPSVRILDTALSRMCFTAPQVYDSAIVFTVKTIVAVLSSSVQCKVLVIDNQKVLRVGGLISESDCVRVMEGCADILRKLGGHKGDLCGLLLHCVIRVAAMARSFPHEVPSISKMNYSKSGSSAVAKLVGYLPNELTIENGEIPSRLLLWQLDPMILKQDISQILREMIKRPFLSLSSELYNRTEWKSKIICLVISPAMFIETRALLHNWFLMTGLASIMELQTEFVGQALDIISRPIWWGISTEIGSKLPFSHAYFPHEHNLSRILSGPISQEYFLLLLSEINGPISQAGGRKTITKIKSVDHNSAWATVMNFPGWFFFASISLFSNKNPKAGSLMRESAAKFIAWILNPLSESNQSATVDCLVKASDFWNKKEPRRRLKLHSKMDTSTSSHEQAVSVWLKEFQEMYTKTSSIKGLNLFFRRVPLGVLLVGPDCLSGLGCSLLLHYAATGTIVVNVLGLELCNKAEAVAGCKMVFDLTDVAESVCCSMFETEEEGMDFVCRLKGRMCGYLLRCVERLIRIEFDGDGPHARSDLLVRIIRWRRQGKDDSKIDLDLDRVCDALL